MRGKCLGDVARTMKEGVGKRPVRTVTNFKSEVKLSSLSNLIANLFQSAPNMKFTYLLKQGLTRKTVYLH